MPVAYNFKKGTSLPSWAWLNQHPTIDTAGRSNTYDGSRYIYYAMTLRLWRFDTWTNAWQDIAVLGTGIAGLTMEYDKTRNVIWFLNGGTTWYVFNLNLVPITIGSLVTSLAAWTLSAALAPALTTAAGTGASVEHLEDSDLVALCLDATGATARSLSGAGTTTTAIDAGAEFHSGMVGCYLRFTSGANAGSARVITGVSGSTLTTTAFGAATAAGNAYVIEPPGLTTALATSSGTTTTLVATGSGWPVNFYRDADVIIVAGTGAGQRRRIASNTVDTLTLAAAVTGNPRTGPFSTAPDATSTFRIVPSSDFFYFTPATATTALHRMDVVATTNTWVAQTVAPATISSGHNLMSKPASAPFALYAARGLSSTVYRYDVGLQTWATLPSFWGTETAGLGAAVAKVPGRNRLFLHVGATSRVYLYNFVTGLLDPLTSLPYAVPTALDGQRARWVKTVDGVELVYIVRAGGQEFFRLPGALHL